MQIEILNETLEFPNKTEAVPEIIQTIDKKFSQAGIYYSHFSVDGDKRYDGLEEYLQDNIEGIEKIKIVGCTLKELADEVILSAVDYLSRAVPALAELAPQFYREPDTDSWQQLGKLLEGIEWLLDSFSLIDREIAGSPYISDYPNWEEYLKDIYSLKEIVVELGQAMKNRDTVLMGDLLNYEVIDLFKNMRESLDNMLPWEV